jgi:two-component system chemotaxis response regulator CheY
MTMGKTVLIVDDSASLRRQVKHTLEGAEFDVLEAEDGERGLAAAREGAVDLMIIDINMPIMSGLEMISKVRALPQHKTTPIFVLTTESGASEARRGKALGATAWIVKPVESEVLVKAIRAVLKV